MSDTQKCKVCGKILPLENFDLFTYKYIPKTTFIRKSNGRRKKCRKCVNDTYTKKYYLKNRDSILVKMCWVSYYHNKYQK